MTVPDGLGGWHVVQLIQNGKVKAQKPYFVKRSRRHGISSLRVKAGQQFTVHLKGVGWTQLDNTIAVDYDNSYVGYGCGFNSNGDVVLNLIATGGPGTHLIDMYPLLYTQQPSYANTPYGMVPVLTYAQDVPGLALGYQLPAIRLADHRRQVGQACDLAGRRGLRAPLPVRQPPVLAVDDCHERRARGTCARSSRR